MISYLLTASVISLAIAGDPDTSGGNPDEQTEETTDTSSPVKETSETDSSTDDTAPDSNPNDLGQENPSEGATENGDETNPLTSSEDSKVIEAVIDVEINTQPTSEDSVDNDTEDEDTTEIEQMMSEIMEEMEEIADAEENAFELEIDTDEDDEDFNYKGNIEYSYVLTMWESPNRNIFHVGQFSGDPQYYFKQAEDWGYTVGGRFQLTGNETLSQLYNHTILGVTGGLQYTSFRINTSVSWTWEQYFAQTQTDKADGFVTYQYDELVPMSGVLWENTLTYSPDDMDFGLQASVGFPFQVNGEREMGQAFTDSWQISTRLNISLVQLGYTRLVYPGHSIDRIQIGSGILF